MHPSSPRRPQDTNSPRRARRAWTLPALTGVLGLTVLVLAQACTTRTVVGVDVGSLEVQPATATVVAGGDLQFTAVVKDDEGVRINGAIASWSSSSPSVLSIGVDGAALALQEGTATVQASFQGVSGTATVTVQPGPEIVASPSSVAIFGAVGGTAPDPAVVQITNGGAGTLAGLSATVEYEAGGATGWLSPALDGTTAPTSLTLSASPTTFSAGTYNATVILAGQDAANSPVRIPVLFSLTQGAPIIQATPATLAFNAPVGSPTPDPVAVQITNGGGGGLASLTASIWYESAATGGWLSGVLSGTTAPTELTVSVDPSGLAPGIYAGEVRVASPNAVNSPQPVIVTLSISASSGGFTVTESGNGTTVSESGSTDDFRVVLDVAPASDVVFNISSADPGEARVSPASLTFTPANWDTPKTVTVRGVDDTLLDGSQSTIVTVSVNDALSNDAFDELPDQTVRVTTTDNDSPGFTVTESGGGTQVSESGTTDDFTVVLNVAPTSSVVFTVVSDDTDEATVSPATLTFTSSNWNTPQTVTVTGVNDALPDGDQVSTITVSVDDANSNDAYDPLADETVDVTTTDDDTAGFTVSKTAITLAEGATDDFTVVLNAQPGSNVVFTVDSDDVTAATVTPTTLTFTPGTWDTPQPVTVTGVDDAIDDGDQTATITVAVDDANSDDAFDGLADKTVDVTTTDNDGAGLTVAPTALTVAEGATDNFTVVLDARPTSQVVLDIASDDETEATVSPVSLTFTPGTWDNPKTVTVTGEDDALDDGSQPATITVAVNDAASNDAFHGLQRVVTVTVTDTDTRPTAAIAAPANGLTFAEGTSISFSGIANDAEDGVLSGASLVWTSSLDAQFGTGTSFSTGSLSAGAHTITLTATDSDGWTGTDQITLTVNAYPVANITAPANGHSVPVGTNVTFTGTGTDPEDGALTGASLVWTSSRDGQIGTGLSFSTTGLSQGSHIITLRATDSGALDDTDQITVTMTSANQAPTATITAPADGHSVPVGTNVTFTGTGTDPEDGALSGASLVWTSNRDGQIGTGASFSTTGLSQGSHIVTLTVTDSGALDDTDQITVTMTSANQAPTATITAPADGHSVPVGTNVTFTGTGTDPEDGALTGASLVWTSSRDGQIGTGVSFSTTGLSQGSHIITLTVTDSGFLDDTDQITVTMTSSNQAPTATITAPADGASSVAGVSLGFTGTGTDPEDGALSGGSLVWTSNHDGQIGTGTSFSTSGLSVNVHIITLTVTDSGGLDDTDQIVVTISAPMPTINLSTSTSGFAATTGGGNPGENTVAITNTGTGTLDGLSAPISYGSGSGWLTATLDATTAPTTLRLNATTGALAAGVYTADVDVTSSASGVTNSPQTVAVTFTVTDPAPMPTINLSTSTSGFAATTGGGNPGENTVTITNTGTGTLDGLSAPISYGSGSGWLTATLDATTAPTTLRLNATTGALAAGVYTADVDVTSSASGVTNSPQTVAVTFTVTDPAPMPTINLSTSTSGFAATTGGGNPGENTVTITNTGTGTLDGLSAPISYGSGSGWLTATLDATTAPTTLRLNATTGALAAGVYTADVDVTSTASGVTNSPQTVAVTFTVTDPAPMPTINLSTSTSGFAATAGGGNPGENTVTITNTGTGTLDGLSAPISYGSGSGWLTATLDATTAPTTLRLNATTGALAAGVYTADVDVTSTASGVTNSPQTVAVTFTVNALQLQLAHAQGDRTDAEPTPRRPTPTEARSTTR